MVKRSQRVALELESVGVVDDAVEDGVGDGRLTDDVVPPIDGIWLVMRVAPWP
jgi:hypothetical protein